MNVFHKVTRESLKKNRTRTLVTVIGIILSSAMICAVTTFTSSFRHYMMNEQMYTTGIWHARDMGSDYRTFTRVKAHEETSSAFFVQQLGYAEAEGCQNEFKPYIYLLGSGEGAWDSLPIHMISGRLPQNGSEILLPEHLQTNGGVKHAVGDKLTLSLGDRIIDGYTLTQNNPCYIPQDGGDDVFNGESLSVREERTYTVVGFYERLDNTLEPITAPGYTAFTVADGGEPSTPCDVYFTLKHPGDIYSFIEEMDLDAETNSDLLMFSGVFRINSFHTMLYSLAAIVIGLIVFGSVALIYNAFSISVSERTRQFGLLSSVGATKRQLRRMVLYEALTVSAIGIPLGIVAGVGGIGITLWLLGGSFRSAGFGNVDLTLHVSPLSIAAAAAVALVTVLISAWIPSKRGSRVSAVEAIRQTSDVAEKGKPPKTSGMITLLFGLPGMLAQKYYRRSRKKYRATVLSLFMSIVLFVSASAFTDYLTGAVDAGFETPAYDLEWITYDAGEDAVPPEILLNRILSTPYVTGASYSRETQTNLRIPEEALTEEGKAEPITMDIIFVDNRSFRSLLQQYRLDEQTFLNAESPLAIAVDEVNRFNETTEKMETVSFFKQDSFSAISSDAIKEKDGYTLFDVVQTDNGKIYRYMKDGTEYADGEFLELKEEDAVREIPLSVGAVIREKPAFIPNPNKPWLIFPISAAGKIREDLAVDTINDISFRIQSDNHGACYTELRKTLLDSELNPKNLMDIAQQTESERSVVTIVRVFSYGFIVLISLIAAANVFNTMATNISLRRRDFAMLRSVGMTQKDLNRMLSDECLLYGSRALLLGIPVSCAITLLIYLSVDHGYQTVFRLPWAALGIAAVSVFAVVFVSMLYARNKIKKDNPIDALRNENY